MCQRFTAQTGDGTEKFIKINFSYIQPLCYRMKFSFADKSIFFKPCIIRVGSDDIEEIKNNCFYHEITYTRLSTDSKTYFTRRISVRKLVFEAGLSPYLLAPFVPGHMEKQSKRKDA